MRMDQRSLRSGWGLTSMWGIGRTIRRKDLGYNIMRMGTSMKEDGLTTKGIIKEHSG